MINRAIVFVFLCLTACISSCGSDLQAPVTDTGSLSFGVQWVDAPSMNGVDALVTRTAIMAAQLDCTTSGVATVQAMVYDANNNYLATGGPWSCSDHTGTVHNIPAGTDRKFVVAGKDASGNVAYRGVGSGATITANNTTNFGTVTAYSFAPVLTGPANGSSVTWSSLYLTWTSRGTSVQLQISSNNSFTSIVVDNDGSSLSLPGPGTYFWRLRASDEYGNVSTWSTVWSFTVS